MSQPFAGTFFRRYGTALSTTAAGSGRVRIPICKAGSNDFAVGADWTPAAGDVKVSKDAGSQNDITTLPTYADGSWNFVLSATEMQARLIEVRAVDSAAKAIDDCGFNIETFGSTSSMYPADYAPSAAGVILTSGTGVDQLAVSGGIARADIGYMSRSEDPGSLLVSEDFSTFTSGALTGQGSWVASTVGASASTQISGGVINAAAEQGNDRTLPRGFDITGDWELYMRVRFNTSLTGEPGLIFGLDANNVSSAYFELRPDASVPEMLWQFYNFGGNIADVSTPLITNTYFDAVLRKVGNHLTGLINGQTYMSGVSNVDFSTWTPRFWFVLETTSAGDPRWLISDFEIRQLNQTAANTLKTAQAIRG